MLGEMSHPSVNVRIEAQRLTLSVLAALPGKVGLHGQCGSVRVEHLALLRVGLVGLGLSPALLVNAQSPACLEPLRVALR